MKLQAFVVLVYIRLNSRVAPHGTSQDLRNTPERQQSDLRCVWKLLATRRRRGGHTVSILSVEDQLHGGGESRRLEDAEKYKL